jgi:hypothetical protein
MPLEELRFTPDPAQDASVFRRLNSLKRINDKPAEEIWRDQDARK